MMVGLIYSSEERESVLNERRREKEEAILD
jgi:hypothetical protein